MAAKCKNAQQSFLVGIVFGIIYVTNAVDTLQNTTPQLPSDYNENWQLNNFSDNFDLNSTFLPNNLTADQIHAGENELADYLSKKIRVLCWIATYPENHARALLVRETWGKRCTVFYFVSTQPVVDTSNNTSDLPPMHTVLVNGSESRYILWNKTKAGFRHAYEQFFDEADWFLKADDDTFIVMENLRMLLLDKDPSLPMYFGSKFKSIDITDELLGWIDGGAGYILSKAALKLFIEQTLPTKFRYCDNYDDSEDIEIAKCLVPAGVKDADSFDYEGKLRFHHFKVEDFLQPDFKLSDWYWIRLRHHHKMGKDCCSKSMIGFHYVNATMMRMMDYLIYDVHPFGVNPLLTGSHIKDQVINYLEHKKPTNPKALIKN